MSDTPETGEVFLIEGNWNTFAKQLKRERDEAREKAAQWERISIRLDNERTKLRDIAERAIEMKEQEVWGTRELPFSWKQLRDQLVKEGGK